MRRTWGRQSRRSRSTADWSCPLCVEALESRIALSHAPLVDSHETMAWAPAPTAGLPMGHDYAEMGFAGYGAQRPDDFHGSDLVYRTDFADAPGRPLPEVSHGLTAGSPYQASAPYQVSVLTVQFIFASDFVIFVPASPLQSTDLQHPKPDAQIGRSSAVGYDPEAPAGGVAGQVRASATLTAGAAAARGPQPTDSGIASSIAIAATSNSAIAPEATPMLARSAMGAAKAQSDAVPASPLDPGAKPPVDSHARPAEGGLGNSEEAVPVPNDPSETAAQQSAAAPGVESSYPRKETLFTTGDISRAALLSNVSLNVEAVDQALEAVMREVEKLGGELVTWIDELSLPPWALATAAAAFVGFGGHCYLKRRGARLGEETGEEESSSWLFTRLITPPGQP
jgi:hypothetical protein